MRCREALIVAAILAGCTPTPPLAAEGKHAGTRSCDYFVRNAPSSGLTLDVDVRCEGLSLRGFAATDGLTVREIRGRSANNRSLIPHGPKLLLAGDAKATSFHYRIDLDAVASERDDPELADRVGDSWIAPASTWLLRPVPCPSAVAVRVHPRLDSPVQFATALAPSGDGFALMAHQLRTATYSTFGSFRERSIDVEGRDRRRSKIHVVTLDGHLDASEAELDRWISTSARAVGRFFGGFPVERALVALVPTPDDDGVGWGALLPENGAGIALLVGRHTDQQALRRDWILVHELFHIGVPSFIGEGKWFDEGLATYYEPIIRARAGILDEAEVWTGFARNMPRARASLARGLEKADDWAGRYWGGATVVLLADLEARRASDGRRGLEAGLRRVLAEGGDARHIWKLARVFETADAELGPPILANLGERYGRTGARVDFESLFSELGVKLTASGAVLSDAAPLAAIRHAIVFGDRVEPAR